MGEYVVLFCRSAVRIKRDTLACVWETVLSVVFSFGGFLRCIMCVVERRAMTEVSGYELVLLVLCGHRLVIYLLCW